MKNCEMHQILLSHKFILKIITNACNPSAVYYIPSYHYYKGFKNFKIDSSWM